MFQITLKVVKLRYLFLHVYKYCSDYVGLPYLVCQCILFSPLPSGVNQWYKKEKTCSFFFFFLIATNWDSSLLRKTDYLISSIHVDTQSLKCFFPLSHVLFHINIYEKYSMCLIYFWKTATTSITKWYISCYITAIFKCRNGTMGSLD